ncbi:hypothetical protein EDD27_7242 [Nonomuraea polychroma]|uniref:UPF0182 protein EDD27_7242 n=1 Tax=Nonomuraea polychroma TaxID=46176 RepID=A0A438MFB0_9ACTN|nr:UPF0182 family protein [Nonomuraea polychroma]RVX44500.1 hypothetical protein EDD27_7242 [Nonomuraea polychroma]
MRMPRRPRLLLPVAIALVAIVALFFLFSGIYTDYLWFDAVDYSSVFTGVVLTEIVLFLVGALLMVAIVGGNMLLAFRMRPMFGPAMFGGASGADRYRMALDPHRKLIFIVGMGLLALFSGSSFAGQWQTWLKFINGVPVGKQDSLHRFDISFYMFDLPFIRMALNFLFTAVIISAVLAAITHYLYGGFRLQSPGVHASKAARVHLSVLLGIFVLLKAVAYWVDRYSLVFSDRGFVHGASYTDVNAVLPAKTILAIIALICAVLFFAGVVRPGGMLPGVSFGLLVLSAILIGGVYPALVEQFQVKPNQQGKEAPYIQRNIEATREAYNVDKTEVETYNAQADPTKVQAGGDTSVSGVRLLDPALVSSTYEQTQRIRGFYNFAEPLDVDRYPDSTGKMIDHIVGVRELTGPDAGQNNWINRHLVYTHGYGFVAAPGNKVDSQGLPDYDAKDMPVTGPLVTSTGLKEPRVYYGEDDTGASYVIAGGNPNNPQELDYPKTGGTGQENTTYTGNGVPVGSFFNRLLYAAKYGEANILLSGDINDNSKILYERNPRDRVQKVAPFLTLDGNPYPAIVDGRIVWIVDGYTTSNDYPYAQSESLDDMTRDTTTDRRVIAQQPSDKINYIRNSVKATVDAYNGTVKLYGWDTNDPVLKTWSAAFPGIIRPASEMSADLRSHVRYPEDLFKVQRYTLSRYHITNPAAFYSGQDFWNVPGDPTQGDRNIKQPPYYLTTTMPGSTPTFSLTTTFVPRQGPNLAAFMAVDSSAGSGYGRIRILRMPSSTPIPGPGQAQNSFQSRFAGELNLLGVGASSVRYGNLLTLPYAGGLVYIEPVYIQVAAGGGQEPYPILQRVLVSYGAKIGVGRTLDEALKEVFGDQEQQQQQPNQQEQAQPNQTNAALNTAIANARKAYEDAQKALQASPPDWDAYGEAQKRLEEALKALQSANAQQPAPTASPTVSPTATPTTAPTGSPSPTASPQAQGTS